METSSNHCPTYGYAAETVWPCLTPQLRFFFFPSHQWEHFLFCPWGRSINSANISQKQQQSCVTVALNATSISIIFIGLFPVKLSGFNTFYSSLIDNRAIKRPHLCDQSHVSCWPLKPACIYSSCFWKWSEFSWGLILEPGGSWIFIESELNKRWLRFLDIFVPFHAAACLMFIFFHVTTACVAVFYLDLMW